MVDLELVIRILVGTTLGGVIGYERDIHGRPRRFAHPCVGRARVRDVHGGVDHLVYFQHYQPGDFAEVDGSRIAASVVSGIGFLAGGAILRSGFNIQGLTTAAGLWLVAAIGLCAGGGMYVESIASTLIGIAALTMLRRFEDKDDRIRRRLTLTLGDGARTTSELVDNRERRHARDRRGLGPGELAPPIDMAVRCHGPTASKRWSPCSRPSRGSPACSSIRPPDVKMQRGGRRHGGHPRRNDHRITFRNPDNDYTVARLMSEQGELTIVGNLVGVEEGMPVRITGEWVVDRKWGKQLKIATCVPVTPKTVVGIERFLGSKVFAGIGPALAKRLVEKFGKDTFDVIVIRRIA